MSDFTKLEEQAFSCIFDTRPGIASQLRELLEGALITERDNTGHGFYTSFQVSLSKPPIDWPKRFIDGPNLVTSVGGQTLLMGFILWLEGGYPSCLEGFQYGTPASGKIDLKDVDLATIQSIEPIHQNIEL